MKKLTFIIVMALLAGCTPKKNSVKSNTATISGVDIGAQCSNVNTASALYGTVYDSTNSAFDFTNRVKALLSVNIQPNNVGQVSAGQADSTGVRFSGQIKVDVNGQILGDQSKMTISIYDSIWLSNKISNPNEQEIRIEFDPKAGRGAVISGQFDTSTGQGFISLRDNFGEIRFEGQMDAQRLSGLVKFQNSANVTGGQGLSGTVGQFYIQRCGFIQ